MVAADTSMYNGNGSSTQAERVPIFCGQTHKLLGRVTLSGLWPAELRQWLWCRGCHVEHEITREQVEEARMQGAHKENW